MRNCLRRFSAQSICLDIEAANVLYSKFLLAAELNFFFLFPLESQPLEPQHFLNASTSQGVLITMQNAVAKFQANTQH